VTGAGRGVSVDCFARPPFLASKTARQGHAGSNLTSSRRTSHRLVHARLDNGFYNFGAKRNFMLSIFHLLFLQLSASWDAISSRAR
jgi:hypothetical protein